jgi:hypothetical protein
MATGSELQAPEGQVMLSFVQNVPSSHGTIPAGVHIPD